MAESEGQILFSDSESELSSPALPSTSPGVEDALVSSQENEEEDIDDDCYESPLESWNPEDFVAFSMQVAGIKTYLSQGSNDIVKSFAVSLFSNTEHMSAMAEFFYRRIIDQPEEICRELLRQTLINLVEVCGELSTSPESSFTTKGVDNLLKNVALSTTIPSVFMLMTEAFEKMASCIARVRFINSILDLLGDLRDGARDGNPSFTEDQALTVVDLLHKLIEKHLGDALRPSPSSAKGKKKSATPPQMHRSADPKHRELITRICDSLNNFCIGISLVWPTFCEKIWIMQDFLGYILSRLG